MKFIVNIKFLYYICEGWIIIITTTRNHKEIVNFVVRFAKQYKKWIFINIISSIIIAGVDIYMGDYIKNFTDRTLYGNNQNMLYVILVLGILLSAGIIFKYLSGISSGKFSFYVIRDIRNSICTHIENLSIPYIEASHSGTFVTKLTSDSNVVQGFFQDTIPSLLYNILVFIFAFIYLLTINWKMLLIAVAFTPITVHVINVMNKPLGKYAKGRQRGLEMLTAVAQDTIGGMYIEKSYNLSEVMQEKYEAAGGFALEQTLKSQKITAVTSPLQIIIRWVPLVSCAIYGGYIAYSGRLSSGSLLAFILLLNYVVDPIAEFPYMLADIRTSMASINRLIEILNEAPENSGTNTLKAISTNIAVEFNNVYFSYNDSTEVLKDINLSIADNTTVALVGSSGSGKTTLFKLLCNFYSPIKGEIKLYGKDLKQWNLNNSRDLFSLVSQDVYLFPVSVAENISYGKTDATMEEIIEAAKMANAHEFIIKLSEGYNTLVGERGIKLSGGQRQRIAIARAFLKNSPILLLDEPTSALDTQSEALIQEALDRFSKNRTVIIIAHRLSTIRAVDKIFVMEKGTIVEKGTHDELMSYDSVYSRLYSKQIADTDSAAV